MNELILNNNLILKQTTLDHAEELFQLVQKNRDYLREFLPWLDNSSKVDDTIESIKASDKELLETGTPRFSIFLEDEIIGTIAFHPINNFHKNGSIGYWIDKSHSGKGYMTEAAKAVVEYGFCVLNLNRIVIRCNTKNLASQKVAEKLGFQYEGTLRECENLYGQFADNKVYSMLKKEYEKIYK